MLKCIVDWEIAAKYGIRWINNDAIKWKITLEMFSKMCRNCGILGGEQHANDLIGDDKACIHCVMRHQLLEFSRKIYLNNVEQYHSWPRAVIVLL